MSKTTTLVAALQSCDSEETKRVQRRRLAHRLVAEGDRKKKSLQEPDASHRSQTTGGPPEQQGAAQAGAALLAVFGAH